MESMQTYEDWSEALSKVVAERDAFKADLAETREKLERAEHYRNKFHAALVSSNRSARRRGIERDELRTEVDRLKRLDSITRGQVWQAIAHANPEGRGSVLNHLGEPGVDWATDAVMALLEVTNEQGDDEMGWQSTSNEIDPKDLVIYQGSGEWSALYNGGELVIVGDHYLIEEKVQELLGIEVRQSDDFMRGGNHREDVAPTLPDLYAYGNERRKLNDEAATLEERAEELKVKAAELRARRATS